jgi:hypothetical protein
MPRSRVRRKAAYVPPPSTPTNHSKLPSRWIAPLMCGFLLVGLAWIVVYYIAGQSIPFMSSLQNYNLLIGFGLLAIGFYFATRWK